MAFKWSSAGTATATVNSAGGVLARSLGVVNMTATSGDRVGTASVRVASAVKAVQLAAPVTTVLAKDTLQITATALGYDDKPMGGRTFTWTSSNPAVATVDRQRARDLPASGSATFTAKSAFTTSAVTVTALERQFQTVIHGGDDSRAASQTSAAATAGVLASRTAGVGADSSCAETQRWRRFRARLAEALRWASARVHGTKPVTDTAAELPRTGSCTAGGMTHTANSATAAKAVAHSQRSRLLRRNDSTLSVGGAHACALNTARRAFCWGRMTSGNWATTVRVTSTHANSSGGLP